MAIAKVTILWQGFTGAPGYTTLFFGDAGVAPEVGAAWAEAADTFAGVLTTFTANGVTLTTQSDVEWYEPASGELIATTAVDPAFGPHTGTGGAQGPLPTGGVVSWSTAGINRGRKVRGRTFCIPMASGMYQNDGTLAAIVVSELQSGAVDLMADSDESFGIWSRPRLGAGGAFFPATSARVPDMAAVLRSRRD